MFSLRHYYHGLVRRIPLVVAASSGATGIGWDDGGDTMAWDDGDVINWD